MMDNLTTIAYTTYPHDDGLDSPEAGAILGIITYALLAITIMFSNTVVMVTYWTERRVWQNISHLFILHLSIADFLVGFSIFPLTIVMVSAGRWPFGELSCKILSAFNYIVTYIPGPFILAVTAFRLFLVTNVSRENVVKRKHVMWVLFVLWVATVGIYIFLAFVWPGITGYTVVDYSSECLLEYLYHTHMSLFMIFFEFVIPFVLLLVMSFGLFWKIRQRSRGVRNTSWRVSETCTNIGSPQARSLRQKQTTGHDSNNKRSKRLSSECSVQEKLQVKGESSSNPGTSDGKDYHEAGERHSEGHEKQEVDVKGNNYLCTETNNLEISTVAIHSQKSTISPIPHIESFAIVDGTVQSTAAKHSNETTRQSGKDSIRGHRKAAVMLFAIVAAFAICWLPYVILSLLFLVYPDIVPSAVFEAIGGILYLNSLINPALYGMTNVHFRRGFVKVLHLPRRWIH